MTLSLKKTISILSLALVVGCSQKPESDSTPKPKDCPEVVTFNYHDAHLTIIKDEWKCLPQWKGRKTRAFVNLTEDWCTIYASDPEPLVHELGHCEFGLGHKGPIALFNWDSKRNNNIDGSGYKEESL